MGSPTTTSIVHDIPTLVVGGGVAGSSAGIALAKAGVPFAVITPPSRGNLDYRIGESLGLGAEQLLIDLGVWEPFQRGGHRKVEHSFASWGSPMLVRREDQRGWILDRLAFDALLHDTSSEQASLRIEDWVRAVQQDASGWIVTTGHGERIRCQFIIDCSGRSAVVARKMTERHRLDRLIACHGALSRWDVSVEVTPASVVEAGELGWWYAVLLPSGKALLAWFTDACPGDMVRDHAVWQERLRTSTFAVPWLKSAGFETPGFPSVSPAGTVMLERAADATRGWAAAGDAALSVDPLSSHGILSALWMGRQVGVAAAAWINGDPQPLEDYRVEVARGASRYLKERTAMYASEQRYPASSFWQQRR